MTLAAVVALFYVRGLKQVDMTICPSCDQEPEGAL